MSFVPSFGDESVAKGVKEDRSVDGIFRGDEVEESSSFAGSLNRGKVDFAESIESETLGTTDVVLAKMLEDCFGCLTRVDDERIQSSCSSC